MADVAGASRFKKGVDGVIFQNICPGVRRLWERREDIGTGSGEHVILREDQE